MRTAVILHKASDIVYLQAQRVTNAMRHKRPGKIVFHHRLFTHIGDDLMLTQQLRDALMELNVIIHVAGARFHSGNQRQLLVIHILHQMRIVVVAFRRPRTRQVCCIAVVFRTGVQQETADFRRSLMIQPGIMQNRSMLVKRHDVAVRHVGVAMTGSSQVSEVDVKLAHPGTERFFRGTVSIHRHFLCFAHTGQFVICFVSTIIMQVVDNPFRVDIAGRDVQLQRAFRNRTDVTDIAASSRQLATIHQQPAVRNLRYRHPGFELRIDLKRVGMIVEKDVNKFS